MGWAWACGERKEKIIIIIEVYLLIDMMRE